jgi:transposase-like protein
LKTLNKKPGRPPRDIDMTAVLSLASSLSVRQIGDRLGIPVSTLNYRLRSDPIDNPFCINDRVRMRRRKTKRGIEFFSCNTCHQSTLTIRIKTHRRGRPIKEFDYTKASELLASQAVVEVAHTLGVHRNTIYRHIELGLLTGRAFRTWIPRQGWIRQSSESVSALCWPYMTGNDPRYEGLVRKVNEAVPRSMADTVRADVCQDILVSVLTGAIQESEIQQAVKMHISQHYKLFPVRDYKTRSLDAVVPGTDQRLIDTLSAESVAERIADAWEANRLTTRAPKRTAHFNRNDETTRSLTRGFGEYNYYRGKYQVVRGKLLTQPVESPGAWTIETASPEELR